MTAQRRIRLSSASPLPLDSSAWALIAATLLSVLNCVSAQAQDRLSEIMENVRANEELYRDLEVVVNKDYRLGTAKYSHSKFLTSSVARTRVVYQGNLLYLRNDENQERMDGESHRMDSLQGFDGERTRVVEQNAFANIHLGRWEDSRLFRPHTVLLSRARVSFPLSVYLKGGEDVRRQPVYADNNWNVTVTLEADDMIDGLPCFKVRCRTVPEGYSDEFATDYFLWLAAERNYIPVKSEAFQKRYHPDLPLEVGRVEEFKEIAPGVWFPFHYSLRIHDSEWLKEGKVVVNNSEDYVVEKVTLDPNYDISLFRNIHIPKGMPVYVVKDGKIIESYVEGEPRKSRSFIRSWRGAVVGLTILCGALVASVVFFRGRARSREISTKVGSRDHATV